MKAINAIVPRSLQVLLVLAILAVLVIYLAPDDFLYPSIGIAAFLAVVAIFLIYRKGAAVSENKDGSKAKKKKGKETSDEDQAAGASVENNEEALEEPGEQISDESSEEDIPPARGPAVPEVSTYRTRFTRPGDKQSAFEVADKYYQMAAAAKAEEEERNTWKPRPRVIEPVIEEPPETEEKAETKAEAPDSEETVAQDTAEETAEEIKTGAENETPVESEMGEPSVKLISDETSLTEEEKSDLENAVWYRCENPYCKHTYFLDVHHIIDEKNGGTNKLENLIVFCPYCHDLAHKNEIPEKEMRLWISNREDRFKFKLNWPYF
jgi:hypothetical protein